jgi:hypothetical protein
VLALCRQQERERKGGTVWLEGLCPGEAETEVITRTAITEKGRWVPQLGESGKGFFPDLIACY